MEHSDSDLLKAFSLDRDSAAFAEIVRRHGPMVMGVCKRILRDQHLVEDAFQATFLILARKASNIREHGIMSHWLYRVAANASKRLQRKVTARNKIELSIDSENAPEPAGQAPEPTFHDLRPILDAELLKLPANLRQPLVLCYFEGKTYDEAAAALKCSADTIRGRLARGRDALRSRLTQRGLAFSSALLAALLLPLNTRADVPPNLIQSTATAASKAAGGALPATMAGRLAAECLRAKSLLNATVAAASVALGLAGSLFIPSIRYAIGLSQKPETPSAHESGQLAWSTGTITQSNPTTRTFTLKTAQGEQSFTVNNDNLLSALPRNAPKSATPTPHTFADLTPGAQVEVRHQSGQLLSVAILPKP